MRYILLKGITLETGKLVLDSTNHTKENKQVFNTRFTGFMKMMLKRFLIFFHKHPMRWTPMFGHLRGKLSYNGLLVWVSISSRAEGQVLAPQLFYFGRRNGRVSMQRNVVKWNTDPGMKTSKSAARAIDLHAAFSLVPSLFPLS